MPTFAVTAPPGTPLGLWVADTEVEAVGLAMDEHPEYDALSGLTAEMVSHDPELVDDEAGDLDEMASAQGFADWAELMRLVPRVVLPEPGAAKTFDTWKLTDGTKAGLLEAFPYLKEDL